MAVTLSRLTRITQQRWRSLVRQDTVDRETARELALHLELLASEHIEAGMAPDEARRAAQRALGNVAVLEEQCRDQRRVGWVHDLRQDFSYGLRVLRRAPAFTAVAAISLAIGIGVGAASLAVIDAVMRQPLPYPDAGRLVLARTAPIDAPERRGNASIADYLAWRANGRTLESIGASIFFASDFSSEPNGLAAESVDGLLVTSSLFPTLQVQPALGRMLSDADPELGRSGAVIVISHRLWRQRFAFDPAIIGRDVRLNRSRATIVGVMPETFRYLDDRIDYWAPLRPQDRFGSETSRLYAVLGRLRPGITPRQADADLSTLIAAQGAKPFTVATQPLRDALFGWATTPLLVASAAAGVVLILGIVNVAGLLLARGMARAPELALRMALGARRGRIVRQLLTESVLLALAGGGLGVLVAWIAATGLRRIAPLPGSLSIPDVTLDLRLVVPLVVLAAGAGLLAGVAPAFANSRIDLARGAPVVGGTPSQRTSRLRHVFAAAQLALAMVLLVGAGLLVQSFARLAWRDLNFDPRGLVELTYRVPLQHRLTPTGQRDGQPQFELRPALQELVRIHDRLQTLPGAASVAGISHHPTNTLVLARPGIRLEEDAADRRRDAVYFVITPRFFSTIGTPVVQGREIGNEDTLSSPWVAVVNEALARQYWPGQHAVGRILTVGTGGEERPREVVGVVRDIPTRRAQVTPDPIVYTSYLQQPSAYRPPMTGLLGRMVFMLRASGDANALAQTARRTVAEMNPDAPPPPIEIADRVQPYLIARHRHVFVLVVLALAATVLAAAGVYGIVSFSVTRRLRELGIRIALGATAFDILRAVGGRMLRLIAAGVGVGVMAALATSRYIASQLFGVSATDPATFAGAALVILAAGATACVVPILRAIRSDPTAVLRIE